MDFTEMECFHFDKIFITGCTGSCQNDNFQWSQWSKFHQNDEIVISFVVYDQTPQEGQLCWRWFPFFTIRLQGIINLSQVNVFVLLYPLHTGNLDLYEQGPSISR